MGNTKYQIMPTRSLYPHLFPYPSSTIESKKAVLLSIAPTLDESEKQQKMDNASAEEFTRCKAEKSKTSRSSFEYRDFDIDVIVSTAEYEKR